jgi:hypothetical protein
MEIVGYFCDLLSQFALIEAIERSFRQVDLVVLTGGVSMGEKVG